MATRYKTIDALCQKKVKEQQKQSKFQLSKILKKNQKITISNGEGLLKDEVFSYQNIPTRYITLNENLRL